MDDREEKTLGFEDRLELVSELTGRIESGALPLEDAVKEYERGMKMLAELDAELGDMNRRVTVLRNGTETETAVLNCLLPGPRSFDQLSDACGLPPAELLSVLTMLQIRGMVESVPGKKYQIIQ